jgi:1-phosphatidylinositol-4-phosphate 5-kinase
MSNPSTLITRFYGLHSIKPTNGRNVRFIVMNNVFDTKLYVEERYDLKGSTIGRNASEKEKLREAPILKDNDFLNVNRKIHVTKEMKEKILDQLRSDCSWLESMKIMDYSLLLGAHNVRTFIKFI